MTNAWWTVSSSAILVRITGDGAADSWLLRGRAPLPSLGPSARSSQAGATVLTAVAARSATTQRYICYIRGHGPKAWPAHSELLRGAIWRRIVFSPSVTECRSKPRPASIYAARQESVKVAQHANSGAWNELNAQIASNNTELLESR